MKVAFAVPLVILSTLSMSMGAHAQDAAQMPVFYARINITPVYNNVDHGESSSDIVSNASRIGLEGDYAFTDSVKLIYQAEYQVNPNDNSFDQFNLSQRNTFIGIESAYGTVVIGRNDTPAKRVQSGIDLFNDLNGDIRTLLVSEVRANDLIHYTSPTMSGFTLDYAAIVDGQDGVAGRLSNSTSTSLIYEQRNYLFGIAIDNNVSGHDSFRLMSRYRDGNLQLGIMYEDAKTSRGHNDGVVVSASYTMDKIVLKAQTGNADQRREGGVQSSIGIDYEMDSESKIFAFVTSTSADNRVRDNDQFGVGFEHNF